MPKISDFFISSKPRIRTGVLTSIEIVDGRLKMSFSIDGKTHKTSISLKTEKSTAFAGYILARMSDIKGISKDSDISDLLGVEVPLAFKRNGEYMDIVLFPKTGDSEVVEASNIAEDTPF